MAEFDAYAKNYNQIMNANVTQSGDGFEYFAEYKARYLSEHVVRADDAKILDFGCGVGNVSVVLKKQMPKAILHGFDPSPESIDQIYDVLKSEATFQSSLEQCDSDYDVIFLAGVMHHILPEDRPEILRQIRQRLKPGGQLVIFEHNTLNPVTRRVVDACPFDKDAVLLNSNEAKELVAQADLKVMRRQFIVFFPKFLSFLRSFENLLGWCALGAQYVVISQKADN